MIKINPEKKAAKDLADWKLSRADLVAAIKVTVDGMELNGDELSQTRMARAVVAMSDTDTVAWVLADNTDTQLTRAQLAHALKLAGETQTALWIRSIT